MTTKDAHIVGCLCPCHGGLRVWRCESPCRHEMHTYWVELQQENRDMASHLLRGAGILLQARDELIAAKGVGEL